jgi:hypothetical protein
LRERGFDRKALRRAYSGFFSGFGNVPGIGTTVETYESAPTWARHPMLLWAPGQISSGLLDPTNTPTTTVRPGLVLGIISATGSWTNYSPTATDGSQVAMGVLGVGLPMLDPFTNTTQAKVWGVIVGGPVQAAKLIGLDLQARADMTPYFRFDDFATVPSGGFRFPWSNFASKAAAYQILASDNFTIFDNTGAVGSVVLTLPPIANGYCFGVRVQADQTLILASSEGANMIALNNAVANSVAFSTGSQKIGGAFMVYSNPAGTKWIVINESAGSNTITVA